MLLLLLLLSLLPLQNDSANDSCALEVKFLSNNFKNILTWSTTSKKEARYNVMYIIYGSANWIEKAECKNITHNWCDLSNETIDYKEQYYGKVNIQNQDCNISKLTDRFNPLLDTILDPPIVNLFSTSTSITVNLTNVVKNLNSTDGISLTYEIHVSKIGELTSKDPYFEIKNLDLQTPYCVSARFTYLGRSSISSNATCIKTKTDPNSEERVKIMFYVLAVIIVIFIVFGAGYSVHKYIHVANLKQPQILNIASNNNNNIVLVDAYNITINVMKIESSLPNEHSTKMSEEEEKTQVKTDLFFTDDGYDASHGTGVTEDDDHGYVSLLEQAPATRPQRSPYDMPHSIVDTPVDTKKAPSVIINTKENLYGRIKCNANSEFIQKKEDAHQDANMSERKFTYLPKNDQNIPKLDVLNHELKDTEESSTGQDADNIDMTDGTDFSECDTLFVDWSPTSHQLYIPNLQNNTEEEVGTEESQEVQGLLSQLYKPIHTEDTPEELTILEQKWELHVKMQE
ncbi:interleukin-20 receptor subunit alpha-like [Leptodactylus fuscus]|uniref:interleukin-20 receptor subunit alpha-like n=1 Tax=Leptodactylus fuscus TaxID=238119 RepID=UPI003F4F29EB